MISRTERATQVKTRMLNLISDQFFSNVSSPDDGVGYEEKADKGNHRKGKSHVANQLFPNDLQKSELEFTQSTHSCSQKNVYICSNGVKTRLPYWLPTGRT